VMSCRPRPSCRSARTPEQGPPAPSDAAVTCMPVRQAPPGPEIY
jgi:hypothetical protein